MNRAPLTEDRLRSALHASADDVEPDESSALDTIRRRGRTAIVRRRAVLGGALAAVVVGVVAVVVPQLGDETSTVDVIDPGPEETTVPEPGPTTTVPPAPAPAEQTYLWPPAGHATYADPLETARSFVAEYVGVADPPLGQVMEEEPRRVQVPVYARGENGEVREDITRSTIHLFQVEDDTWRVTRALSDAIVVDYMEVAQSAASILVGGRGRGFEGTIIITARDGASPPNELTDHEIVIAGSAEELLPFETTLTLSRPPALTDSVFLFNDAGFEGAVPDFTVLRAETTVPPEGSSVEVYFVDTAGAVVPVARSVGSPAVLNGALAALFDGPTDAERAQGIRSALPELARDFPPTATITDGVAHVDIPWEVGLGPDDSGGGQPLPPGDAPLVVEQLWRTVFQFPNISQVEFTLSGSCEDFGTWIGQRGICLFDRALLEDD
jgi:hypothetical protein